MPVRRRLAVHERDVLSRVCTAPEPALCFVEVICCSITDGAGKQQGFIRTGCHEAKVTLVGAAQFCTVQLKAKTVTVITQVIMARAILMTSMAQVSVVLWNTGGDAYRYNDYGDFITIQKKIGQSCATWAIYGARGQLVRCANHRQAGGCV